MQMLQPVASCFVGEYSRLSHAASRLCLPPSLIWVPSQLWARRTRLKKKRYNPLPLLRDKRAMPTLGRGSWHFTSSHPAYLGVACVVYLKWAEWKVCQTAPRWINESELVHKSASPESFSSLIACGTIDSELLPLHSSIWLILKYPHRLIYLDNTVHFLHIYSWSSYNCWLEIHQIQI